MRQEWLRAATKRCVRCRTDILIEPLPEKLLQALEDKSRDEPDRQD